jgi:hypothetical protein
MDKLQEIINTLSEDDKREFRIFINRQKSKKERKDLDLFELICKQLGSKEIQSKLYKTPNKVAYHTLRKRLLKHLTDFIVLKQIDEDTTASSSISGLISMSTYLFKNQSNELAWKFLAKAEQSAIENEQHELLNNIYHLQIDSCDDEFSPEINEIYNKWKSNKELVDENERVNIAYNFIKKELNEVINKGEDKDVNELVEGLLKKYGLNDTVFKRPKILYKVLDLTRKVKFSKKDFYSFEPYVIDLYNELLKHGFSKKNHYFKINILYMIAHSLYRNKKFEKSTEYLSEMLVAMNEYKNSYFQQFYPKYIMLLAANYSFSNKNTESISLLENIKPTIFNKLTTEEQLNIRMNTAIYLGYSEDYKKCNLILQTLNHTDNWLIKKMGIEWVLKKNMIEIMIQYELENYEISLNRIRSFERSFSNLFNHPIYSRANQFMQIIKKIISNPHIIKDKAFIDKVVSSMVIKPSEQEDLQAMTFYSWLKSKMQNKPFYDVLLDVVNTSSEDN